MVGRVTPCAPAEWRAEDCPPNELALTCKVTVSEFDSLPHV